MSEPERSPWEKQAQGKGSPKGERAGCMAPWDGQLPETIQMHSRPGMVQSCQHRCLLPGVTSPGPQSHGIRVGWDEPRGGHGADRCGTWTYVGVALGAAAEDPFPACRGGPPGLGRASGMSRALSSHAPFLGLLFQRRLGFSGVWLEFRSEGHSTVVIWMLTGLPGSWAGPGLEQPAQTRPLPLREETCGSTPEP